MVTAGVVADMGVAAARSVIPPMETALVGMHGVAVEVDAGELPTR